MKPLSEKRYLELMPPTEEDARSDDRRLRDAIGLEPLQIDLQVLRQLHRILPDSGWRVTATVCFDGIGWHLVRLEAGNTTAAHYGVAVDLGSTTVCMELFDLNSGTCLCAESAYNRQIAFGEDILTRVFYAKDSAERTRELQGVTAATFCQVLEQIEEQTGIGPGEISAMTVAGNTTMMHFFLGLDAFAVFATPYAPHAMNFDFIRAEELGLPTLGYVYCVPCRANYLGGDIISGMVATGIPEQDEISVFLDIGTNGELVVGNREFLLAGAGAAGPALEGGVVKTGMRAVPGAVTKCRLDSDGFHLEVLGGGEARGLCGSGIVDLICTLFLNGIVDRLGHFVPEAPGVILENGEYGITYAPGLVFWQSDLNAFLTTKAAANTMVEYILDAAGIPMEQVARFYVAGAFGTHLDKESAVTIGLYPDIPREQIVNGGNTSLQGAGILLLDRDWIPRMQQITEGMEYIQFGAVADFVHRMVGAKAIPHTDLERYPTVKEKLKERNLI